jgi:hypothetical protein
MDLTKHSKGKPQPICRFVSSFKSYLLQLHETPLFCSGSNTGDAGFKKGDKMWSLRKYFLEQLYP